MPTLHDLTHSLSDAAIRHLTRGLPFWITLAIVGVFFGIAIYDRVRR